MAKRQPIQLPIGERLRHQRVGTLGKGLREMARQLDIAPAHLTDIESGRRNPSEDLLLRIATAYQMPEHDLRSAFSKPDSIVQEIASASATESQMVPQLLRSVRGLSVQQYEHLIQQARKLPKEKGGSGA
ncbi:MAG: helix-turn-helix domain-containing protein [Planctomycetota bacterium]